MTNIQRNGGLWAEQWDPLVLTENVFTNVSVRINTTG